MTWRDDGVDVLVDISTDGDVIPKTTTATYLFLSSSGGIATGWTQYLANGAVATDANFTVTNNGQSISNALTTGQPNRQYGVQRDFPIVFGNRYVIGFDVRTMENKVETMFECHAYSINAAGTVLAEVNATIQVRTTGEWMKCVLTTEPLTLNFGHSGATGIRVVIHGRYNLTDQVYWGYQFANFWITEVDMAATVALQWRRVTCDVKGVTIRYGRARFNERFDVATCAITVDNTDGEYAYRNPHPFNLRPGRFVRVLAQYKSVSYPLYWGIIDSLIDGYALDGRATTTINCVDLTTLGSAVPVPTARGSPDGVTGAYMGGRIKALLAVTNVLPAYWQIQQGVWGFQPPLSNARTIRDEIGVSADSENGLFYANRSGVLCYDDRATKTYPDEYNNVTADIYAGPHLGNPPVFDSVPTQATAPIIDPFELNTDWSQSRVINRVTLAVAGGVARQYDDAASQKDQGVKTYQRMDLVCLEDSYGVQTLPILANEMMAGWANPVLRVNTVTIRPTAQAFKGHSTRDSWKWLLKVFPLWLVRVWYVNSIDQWGYETVVYVQSVEHRITVDEWETTLAVDQPQAFVRFEMSDAGWDFGAWDQNNWDGAADWARWSSGIWSVNTYG